MEETSDKMRRDLFTADDPSLPKRAVYVLARTVHNEPLFLFDHRHPSIPSPYNQGLHNSVQKASQPQPSSVLPQTICCRH